jgi:ABC-type nitrate/sulfonate/bicarbonate transport system substrate-binding protein
MSANLAISAGIAGEIDVLGSIGSAIRSIQRGAPLRVISVTWRRPLFFLVARPEYGGIKDLKGKTMGIVTFGGSQHTTAKRMLALGGLNADKELTAIQVGEESVLLQALYGELDPGGCDQPAVRADRQRKIQHENTRDLHGQIRQYSKRRGVESKNSPG